MFPPLTVFPGVKCTNFKIRSELVYLLESTEMERKYFSECHPLLNFFKKDNEELCILPLLT